MSKIRIWWADTRGKVIVTLVALWIGSLVNHYELRHTWQPLVTVGAVSFFDYIVSFIRHKKGVITMSSVVTGLLIGLIFYDGPGSIPLLTACLMAVIGKQLVALGDHRHIFNPAALGILLSSIIFQRPVAWWGAAWGLVPAAIVLIGVAYALFRIRRLWMAIIFLVIYGLAFPFTIDGTVFLFAFIMLPEPITSLGGNWWGYGWGVLVGGIMLILTFLFNITIDPFLSALLLADLVGGAKRFLWSNV